MRAREAEEARTNLGRVYAMLVLTTMLWGAGPVAGKFALSGIPTVTLGVLRFGLAAAILCLVARPRWRALGWQDLAILGALGMLGVFLNHLCFFFALGWAPASHASIIAPTTSPIWTMVLAAWREGERVSRSQGVGILVCALGVVLVVQPGPDTWASSSTVLIGDLLFLLAGITWGIYSYLVKVAMRRLSSETILAGSMASGALLLVPLALLERPWAAQGGVSLAAWGGLAYLVVANTLLAFYWWNLGIQRVGAGRTAVSRTSCRSSAWRSPAWPSASGSAACSSWAADSASPAYGSASGRPETRRIRDDHSRQPPDGDFPYGLFSCRSRC
jgi:drug/metabolite transporter (DMT)-like permease